MVEKNWEDDPVQHDPQLTRVLGQRDAQKAHDPVNGELRDGPCRDDPEWGGFTSVILPQVGMDTIHSQFSVCRSGLSWADRRKVEMKVMNPL